VTRKKQTELENWTYYQNSVNPSGTIGLS